MRPCTCDRCEIGKPWDYSQCAVCWYYHNDSRYRELWGGPPLTEPGLLTKAVNFGKAVVQHTIAGRPILPTVESEKRLAICQGCDQFVPDKHPRCRKCGCGLAVKATWAEQQCPLGKWPQ